MENPIESIQYRDHVILKEYIKAENTYLISCEGRQMKVTAECLADSVLDEQTLFELLLGLNRHLKESINLDKQLTINLLPRDLQTSLGA